jgi:hypothetical protein
MKKYSHLSEMLGRVDEELYKEFSAAIGEEYPKKSFEESLGGDVFIIESANELKEVIAVNREGRHVDIRLESVIFDAATWLPSKNWVWLFTATSDAGGPCFIVPKKIASGFPLILASIKDTNASDGKVVRSFRGPLICIERVSPASGVACDWYMPLTEDQLDAHVGGQAIDIAMPQLTAAEREFILTGITGEEWDLLFPRQEDEEEGAEA